MDHPLGRFFDYGALGFMVSFDALVDGCKMLFGAVVYHWWMMLFVVSLTLIHLMVSFYYDFGLWWVVLVDTTSITMVIIMC
jgi:hypothetical protein